MQFAKASVVLLDGDLPAEKRLGVEELAVRGLDLALGIGPTKCLQLERLQPINLLLRLRAAAFHRFDSGESRRVLLIRDALQPGELIG